MEKEGYNIKIIGHSKLDGHIEYIISVEKNGENFTFTERYSGLRNLSENMRKFTNKPTFPKYPPKKFFGGEDEKFLTKRQQELNTFFDLVSKDAEFCSLPPLIKFIKEKCEKLGEKKNTNVIKEKEKETPKKNEENDIRKISVTISEKDYNNIVKEYNNKFYDIKNFYDTENNNSMKFVNFFRNNKINSSDENVKIEVGDENIFSKIKKEDAYLISAENQIKNKIVKMNQLYQSFNDIYCTDGIIVSI